MAASRYATRSLIQTTHSGERPRVRNRRALVRLPVDIQVALVWDGTSHDAIVTDLGMGGLFVECEEQAPFAASVLVVMTSGKGNLELPATVRWNGERGMGLQFGLLGAGATHAIAELLPRRRAPR